MAGGQNAMTGGLPERVSEAGIRFFERLKILVVNSEGE